MGNTDAAGLLPRIVGLLNDVGIPFMIAGSLASQAHGVDRETHDLEIVVDPDARSLEALLAALPRAAYHGDAEEAREALRTRTAFNIIDLGTATRIDFIVKKDRPFSRAEMERRVATEVSGVRAFVASAEDTIIAELEWSKDNGGSETQLRNVASILAKRRTSLDLVYVKRWVDELGLAAEWARASAATT